MLEREHPLLVACLQHLANGRVQLIDKETGRRARIYEITKAGQKQLAAEKESWERLTSAVNLIFTNIANALTAAA